MGIVVGQGFGYPISTHLDPKRSFGRCLKKGPFRRLTTRREQRWGPAGPSRNGQVQNSKIRPPKQARRHPAKKTPWENSPNRILQKAQHCGLKGGYLAPIQFCKKRGGWPPVHRACARGTRAVYGAAEVGSLDRLRMLQRLLFR